MWWRILTGIVAGILLVYLALLVLLWRYARRYADGPAVSDVLRLVPDVIRLLRRLASDRQVSRDVRIRLVLLLIYLASPLDLIPDFIPVIGYLDDALIVAIVLRLVIRRAGADAISRHWPGTAAGLAIVQQLGRGRGQE